MATRTRDRRWAWLVVVGMVAAAGGAAPAVEVAPGVRVTPGAVNGVTIQGDGRTLVVYGDPEGRIDNVDAVLFTHHRRDVVWAGWPLVERGVRAVIPAAESDHFLKAEAFWDEYWTGRFHDYKQQTSRVLTTSAPAATTTGVRGGDSWEWAGPPIRVMDTPGYTRGAVSYLIEAGGARVACVGDLIYGDGKILDLFSLQDAIPEAREDGYHGYAARAADVMRSLRRIAEWRPDVLIPARGPVIDDPPRAIAALERRLRAVFASHFRNDALRWYRGEERFGKQVSRILGDAPFEPMPMAETIQNELPSWIIPINNSRLLISESGAAFLIDCGGRDHIERLGRLRDEGRFKTLEGLYITHYHDDHSDQAQALADQYQCPIYACEEMRDILERPGAYRMPCLTPNAIRRVEAMPDGAVKRWREFELTFSYFPGQTLLHGGLRVKKDRGETVFFVGDSFVPSGLDDYCLLNRNLFAPRPGYEDCLRALLALPADHLLINQHVEPAFRFSTAQLESMIENVRERRRLLADLFPWDDPNYGVDDQWARFYPHGSEAKPGETIELKFIVWNHSPSEQTYRITLHRPAGWTGGEEPAKLKLAAGEEGSVSFSVTAPRDRWGVAVITADVAFGSWDLRRWAEALIKAR